MSRPHFSKPAPVRLAAPDRSGVLLFVDEHGLGVEHRARPSFSTLRYHRGRFRDELEVAGERLLIPAGKGSAVQELIACARLEPALELAAGNAIENCDASTSYWLGAFMAQAHPTERMLAVLSTSLKKDIESDLGPNTRATTWFVCTSHRAALVAVGTLGDVWRQDLGTPIEVQSERGRDRVRSGEYEWLTSLTNEARYADVAAWQASETPGGPLRAALNAALESDEMERAEDLATALLEDPAAAVACWLRGSGDAPTLLTAFERSTSPIDLLQWVSRWKLETAQQTRLVRALRQNQPHSILALRLHAELYAAGQLNPRRAQSEDDLGPAVAAEIEWAEHQHAVEHTAKAQKTLDDALAFLADGDALDLVPHVDTEHINPQVKARLSILGAQRKLFAGELRERATLAMARIEPLRLTRIETLHGCVQGDLADRASVVGSLLTGNIRSRGLLPPERSTALTDDELARLRHPVGRTDEFVGMISSYVATVARPDHSALKAYCPKLEQGPLRDIFERATSRLAVEADIFVSQGEHAIGCRAHEGTDSGFVILGGDHLKPHAGRALGPAELAFAFACELTHLRLGHARVTSGELWKGAFDLGVSGFDILVGTVPLLGRYKIGEGISKVANAFKDGTAQKVASQARKLFGRKASHEEPAAKATKEDRADSNQLIAAHRLMQLTADRAGLVLCGHPGAAIYAMLALDTSDALAVCEKEGLVAMMSKTTDRGPVYPELAVRVSALLSFWLSDDYASVSAR